MVSCGDTMISLHTPDFGKGWYSWQSQIQCLEQFSQVFIFGDNLGNLKSNLGNLRPELPP